MDQNHNHKIIKQIYGSDGGIGDVRVLKTRSGVWTNILRTIEQINKLGVPLDSLMTRKVISGEQTSFWNDHWSTSGGSVRHSFPRLYALELDKDCLLGNRWKIVNGNWQGVWSWRSPPRGRTTSDLNSLQHLLSGLSLLPGKVDAWTWNATVSGKFSVKSLSDLIQSKLLAESNLEVSFKWNSWVPKKVNICLWTAFLNRLPTRSNLTNKGINLESVDCLFCNDHEETLDHCLISCPKIRTTWLKIWSWWNIRPPDDLSLRNILSRKIKLPFNNKLVVNALFGVCYVLLWSIWKWRNKILHAPPNELEKTKHEDIFPSVHMSSLLWLKNRSARSCINWDNWVSKPNSLDVSL